MRSSGFLGLAALAALVPAACQSYNMEEVDPQTIIAVETSGTFAGSKPPNLLIVQDRSGSMNKCFGETPANGAGEGCDSDGDFEIDAGFLSRMDVAQRVMSTTVGDNGGAVRFGLVIYGVGAACGEPVQLAAPGDDTSGTVREAYLEHPNITQPSGGTPTTKALEAAYDLLVDSEGNLLQADRANYVVLVTDGLMNCNADHPMPCTCYEGSCPLAAGGVVAQGEVGDLADPQLCLDDEPSLAAVRRLAEAGVKTFVIGLGDSFTGDGTLGVQTLNRLADAGGMPRTGSSERFYSAADEEALAVSIDEIIKSIDVPCEYVLDGPVCDGRLIAINFKIDGQDIATTCSETEGEATWFFKNEGGSLDPQRIVFSQALCDRANDAQGVVEVTIRGVEEGCTEEGQAPSCGQ